MEDGDRIRIVCRVRPVPTGRRPSVFVSDDTVTLTHGGYTRKTKTFAFDSVLGGRASQTDVFAAVGEPTVASCFDGINATVLAFGQTASGKTWTMFGGGASRLEHTLDDEADSDGLVPRLIRRVFQLIGEADERAEHHRVRCSFFEIYNERIYDLLDSSASTPGMPGAPPAEGLQVRENPEHGVYVEALTETEVGSESAAMQLLARGLRSRHVGATKMNRESSRSHAVFSLYVQSSSEASTSAAAVPSPRRVIARSSRLALVDLAGSERQRRTRMLGVASELGLKESGNINRSLSALGLVIGALVERAAGRQRHVHFRDSKLTFLLRDSLGGNARTALLATVSPDAADLAESTRTLEFVQRAKIIVNRPKVNVDDTPIEVALGASDVMAGGFEAELAVLRRSVSQRGSTPILPPLPLSSFVRGRERMRASSIGAGAPKRPSTAPKWQRPSWRSRATSPRLPCGSQSKRHARSAALAPSASPPW